MSLLNVLNLAALAGLALAGSFVGFQLRAIRRLMESTRSADDFPRVPLWPVAGGGGPPPPYGDPDHEDQSPATSGSKRASRATGLGTGPDAETGSGSARRKTPTSAGGSGVPAWAVAGLGFCVWTYRAGEWQILLQNTPDGVDPGPPPAGAGEYEGQCVRTLCVPEPV